MLFTITPAALPDGYGEAIVTVAQVKAWLRVIADDEDALIETLRDMSIDLVEKAGNLWLGPRPDQTATFAGFGPGMRIGTGPAAALSVTAIDYIDSAGVEAAIDEGGWTVDAGGGVVPFPSSTRWPIGAGAVTVTFDAGYPADAVPAALKGAVMMFAANLYANRETLLADGYSGDVPAGIMAAIRPYRMPVL
jgi:uncharacterized phiE125 gp8 family phage protein